MITAETKYGKLSGSKKDGYTAFFGVPYAKPPVGELRWRAPEKPEPWDGVRDAKTFPKRAWQMTQLYRPEEEQDRPANAGINYGREFYVIPEYMTEMSEDCLYLNIWTPARSADEKLPVALWIHGGAYINGMGAALEFDGETFAKNGVILVTINYRLGLFGFLCHRELRDEQGRSGNYGTLDQIAALNWVRENISAFGGDPDRITIFGQSAGAMSVQTLCCSPLAKGKFAGAILQSGGGYQAGLCTDMTMEQAFALGEAFTAVTGAETAEELRALSPEEVMGAMGGFFGECAKRGILGLPFMPVVDGWVMAKGYNDTLKEGLHPDVPYLLGSTADDIVIPPDVKEDGKHLSLYYGCINWSLNDQALGRRPAYVYSFERRLPGSDDGAFHSAELWYVFHTLDRCWRPMTDRDYELADRISGYWANFCKTGDPNGEGLPRWEPCGWKDHSVLVLDAEK